MNAAVSDDVLRDALAASVGARRVHSLRRRPYRYATSAPLEEVVVQLDDGEERAFIYKDLARDRLLGDARQAKPEFLYEPRREIETYRGILDAAGVGPRCLAAAAEPDTGRCWLLIERAPGVEVWQVGEPEVWDEVAGWLAGFHRRFRGREEELRAANPYLLEHSEDWYRSWRDRATAALSESADPRAGRLVQALERYEDAAEPLADLPRTLIHGEFYPANVLVDRDAQPMGIRPVDWEMAAIGTGLTDLAAFVSGWGAADRERLTGAYFTAWGEGGPSEAASTQLRHCRLHVALQWIGWSPHWRPPPEHARDWLSEAVELAEELDLL
jgi:aminoglycoside phosphotransferase (APT) family kinase protein